MILAVILSQLELKAMASQAQPLAAHGEIGNGRKDESRVADRHSKPAPSTFRSF